MTGGSVSRSAGVLSRANELEKLNGQHGRHAGTGCPPAKQKAEDAQRELQKAAV